jgi:hypothetical protein
MKKLNRLPREEAHDRADGSPADGDVEGHRALALPGTSADTLRPGMPGTGGDAIRRPGGELTDEDDVEGHLLRGQPGTGGDS